MLGQRLTLFYDYSRLEIHCCVLMISAVDRGITDRLTHSSFFNVRPDAGLAMGDLTHRSTIALRRGPLSVSPNAGRWFQGRASRWAEGGAAGMRKARRFDSRDVGHANDATEFFFAIRQTMRDFVVCLIRTRLTDRFSRRRTTDNSA